MGFSNLTLCFYAFFFPYSHEFTAEGHLTPETDIFIFIFFCPHASYIQYWKFDVGLCPHSCLLSMSANIKPVAQATSSNKENDKREETQHQISFKFLSFSVSLIFWWFRFTIVFHGSALILRWRYRQSSTLLWSPLLGLQQIYIQLTVAFERIITSLFCSANGWETYPSSRWAI